MKIVKKCSMHAFKESFEFVWAGYDVLECVMKYCIKVFEFQVGKQRKVVLPRPKHQYGASQTSCAELSDGGGCADICHQSAPALLSLVWSESVSGSIGEMRGFRQSISTDHRSAPGCHKSASSDPGRGGAGAGSGRGRESVEGPGGGGGEVGAGGAGRGGGHVVRTTRRSISGRLVTFRRRAVQSPYRHGSTSRNSPRRQLLGDEGRRQLSAGRKT